MNQSLVIIGGGHAGVTLADETRSRGWDGPITIVEAEEPFPYQRPPLSKDFLTAGGEAEGLRGPDFFESRGVTLIRGNAAREIDRSGRTVVLDNGERLPYDALVLATGGRHRELPVPGAGAPGVHKLRTLQEAHELSSALRRARSAAIVGAGFIGLEVAFAAAAQGLEVDVFDVAPAPLTRVASAELSAFASRRLSDAGIRCHAGVSVEEVIVTDGRASGLRVDGREYRADIVLIGIGVVPNSELAEAAGLAVTNGIEVDASLRTSDPSIWAIGDCALHPNEFAGGTVRIESVQNATDQARHVARYLTGEGAASAYREVPWFWSHLGDDIVNIAGIATATTHSAVIGDEEARSFSILRWNGDDLVCVESINARRDHLVARRLLAAGVSPRPEDVTTPGFTLRALAAGVAG